MIVQRMCQLQEEHVWVGEYETPSTSLEDGHTHLTSSPTQCL